MIIKDPLYIHFTYDIYNTAKLFMMDMGVERWLTVANKILNENNDIIIWMLWLYACNRRILI